MALRRRLLRALAHLDPDVKAVISARDDRRRQGLTVLLGRLRDRPRAPAADDSPGTVTALIAPTSFETFDALAGPTESCSEALPVIHRLIDAVLGAPAAISAERGATGSEDRERGGAEAGEVSGRGASDRWERPAPPGGPGLPAPPHPTG